MSFQNSVQSFFRNILPKFLFPFTFLLFMYQLYCNIILYTNNSSNPNKYKYFLLLYILFYLLYLISSINIYLTSPGYVTEKTNERFIFIYKVSRKTALERGAIYNLKHNNNPDPPYHFSDGSYYYESDCENDEYEFKQSLNQKNLYKKCREELSYLYVKKCYKCHVTKVFCVHHCSFCHKCIYNMDHHCIWFNKCIGQFNQKYFILFNFYLFLASFLSFFNTIVYFFMNNLFQKDFNLLILFIFHIVFDVIFLMFSIKLLYDQYTNLIDNELNYDFDYKKMVEIRFKYEQLCEIFGNEFGFNWFMPFYAGGFYHFMNYSNFKSEFVNDDKKNN